MRNIKVSPHQGKQTRSAYEKLNNLYESKNVSFDFFDTLVFRSTVSHYRGWRKFSFSFGINRFFAEVLARVFGRLKGRPEVRSAEIYKFMLKRWQFSDEILIETQNLQPNLYLKEVFNKLVAGGTNVFVISDTHFSSEQISFWLEKFKFASVPIYTSQEYLKTKSTGLFQAVLEDQKILPSDLTHIGDNQKSDIDSATKLDISTIYLPDLISQIVDIGILSKRGLRYLIRQADAGLRILSLLRDRTSSFESSANKSDLTLARALGFITVGPISASIAESVHLIAQESGSDLILYSSRDGWLPYLFHANRYLNDEVRYFKTSRRLIEEPNFNEYVVAQIGNSKSICIYDLGWRGSTLSVLNSLFPDLAWIGCFGYVRGSDLPKNISLLKGNRSQNLALWRSRDFVEILFSDPSAGYVGIDANLNPVERQAINPNNFSLKVIEGAGMAHKDPALRMSSSDASLLLYATCRYPSQAMVNSLSESLHDIKEGEFRPLVTNTWSRLFSTNRIMWPYSAFLQNHSFWPLSKLFRLLVLAKESIQRFLNLLARHLSD